MIDDIWERINLVKMGIPPPDDQNESKVVFTSGEGLLDEYRNNNIHVTFNRGEFIIGPLKLACLIESDESEEFVRMHDVIRDMALWVANSSGWNRSKILVLHGSEEFVRMHDMITWPCG